MPETEPYTYTATKDNDAVLRSDGYTVPRESPKNRESLEFQAFLARGGKVGKYQPPTGQARSATGQAAARAKADRQATAATAAEK